MIRHLACIMDGNRRWAIRHGWQPWRGHQEGLAAAKRVISFCLQKKVQYLSLYTFSLENFNRSAVEKDFLFTTLAQEAQRELPVFIEHGIAVRFIGDWSYFPESLIPVCKEVEEQTKHGTQLVLNLLFCYGGRQEIMASVKSILKKIMSGSLAENEISLELFEEHLWTKGTPPPDLILRTGGVKRLSNFLLYQSAYSEFYFLDCLWPELKEHHLQEAMSYYEHCQRNFGV